MLKKGLQIALYLSFNDITSKKLKKFKKRDHCLKKKRGRHSFLLFWLSFLPNAFFSHPFMSPNDQVSFWDKVICRKQPRNYLSTRDDIKYQCKKRDNMRVGKLFQGVFSCLFIESEIISPWMEFPGILGNGWGPFVKSALTYRSSPSSRRAHVQRHKECLGILTVLLSARFLGH